jgi:hypothetical protein
MPRRSKKRCSGSGLIDFLLRTAASVSNLQGEEPAPRSVLEGQ